MNENLKKIFEELTKDEKLIEKVAEINNLYPDLEENSKALVELAKEIGIDITVEEIFDSNNTISEELSDEELNQVAGGKMIGVDKGQGMLYYSDCMCVLGGGGSGDNLQKACACVLGGAGELTREGKKLKNIIGDTVALKCVAVGVHEAELMDYYNK